MTWSQWPVTTDDLLKVIDAYKASQVNLEHLPTDFVFVAADYAELKAAIQSREEQSFDVLTGIPVYIAPDRQAAEAMADRLCDIGRRPSIWKLAGWTFVEQKWWAPNTEAV